MLRSVAFQRSLFRLHWTFFLDDLCILYNTVTLFWGPSALDPPCIAPVFNISGWFLDEGVALIILFQVVWVTLGVHRLSAVEIDMLYDFYFFFRPAEFTQKNFASLKLP